MAGGIAMRPGGRGGRRSGLIVGYESHNYGAARNTYAPVDGVSFTKVRRVPVEKISGVGKRGYGTAFVPLGPSGCDLVHLWNRVSFGRAPWGASFEAYYPYVDVHRHPDAFLRLRKRARGARFLIGMSEWAALQVRLDCPELTPLLHVIPPEQRVVDRSRPYPALDGPLRAMFVGVSFFGKGGEAVLRCVEKVGDELDLHLTIVSPVAGGDYGGTPPSDVDVDAVRRRLEQNQRITWIPRADNARVLELMQEHHVGLLPTFADTYGYVALEFQALGIPSITSNVQALPEFTSADTGWSVQVDLDERGVWVGRQRGVDHRRASYHQAVDSAAEQIERFLREIRAAPAVLSTKHTTSRLALVARIAESDRAARLRSIYQSALG